MKQNTREIIFRVIKGGNLEKKQCCNNIGISMLYSLGPVFLFSLNQILATVPGGWGRWVLSDEKLPAKTFWQALLPGPSCLLPPSISAAKTLSSALHRDEGFPHLTSPLPPLHLTHHNTSLCCALPSSCQKPPALLAHLFLLLSFQILKSVWSTPKHCCDAAWLQAAPGQGTQRIAQPCLHGAARSVFQGWQPHHEYISRRAQPFILILINAWRDPDFCKYILLYVLSSQGRVFKACSK